MIVSIAQSAVTIVLFFLILGTLVVIHELGHFITARMAGVRVLEFGVGFPPRAKVLSARGETLYTLNWLPIGGFVKLEGEDGDDSGDPRSFANAPLLTRLGILVAGVAMNLATAFSIFFLIALLATPTLGLRVDIVEPGSPAAAAGITPGDTIATLDGERFEFRGETEPLSSIAARAGETVTIGLIRNDGTETTVEATLRSPDDVQAGRGALGIRRDGDQPWGFEFLDEHVQHDPVTSLGRAANETVTWFGLILNGLVDLGRSFVADPTAPPAGVTGPVGIATQIGDVFWGEGVILTLYVVAVLSANLALVNALPFPPLDGGRMLVITLKAVFGSRISLRAERLTYFVGFAFLMAFLIWVTVFDVIRGGAAT